MLVRFFSDLGRFFNKVFAAPWADVPGNFDAYGSIFSEHNRNFTGLDWFFYVLFFIFFIALIGAILFGLFILIRKYVRFVKKELDKDDMRQQVERLNYELYQATQEKDKILNLKSAYMGVKAPEDMAEADSSSAASDSRFPKLVSVDELYKDKNTAIMFKEGLSLEELCNKFRNYSASKLHLYYTIDTIRQLFAGIATSKLIILEGISGTGKTSLATALGKFLSFDSALVPVQPSWKDRSELIGYYNEFTKKFNETEFFKALYVATYRKDLDVIILDEMNLARIEYYFAEFLSIMEIKETDKWTIDIVPNVVKGDPKNLKDGKLLIPQNVVFFGTANNDDSTSTITDKVYDRAISLFFDDKGREFEAEEEEPISIPYAQFEAMFAEAKKQYPISDEMVKKFETLDNYVIKHFKLAFGNRILKQIETFIPVYIACGGTEVDGYDFIFTNKILKKFESLNIAYLKNEIEELDAYLYKLYGKSAFKLAHAKLDSILKVN